MMGCTQQNPAGASLDRQFIVANIHKGMDRNRALEVVGLPNETTGSGLTIDIYQGSNGEEVKFGYTGHSLLYVYWNKELIVGD